jgi:Flp pilus assembly protein TadG
VIRMDSFRSLRRNERGVSIPEFGLLLIPLSLMLLGGLDMAYQVYVRAIILGSLEQAARMTTLQTVDSATVEAAIEAQIRRIVPNATIQITKGSFYQYSDINAMERITLDKNNNGNLDSGDCWEDVDHDGSRNLVRAGRENSIGGADDIVRYNVAVSYRRLLPIYRFISLPETASLSATTMVRRQPYEGQGTPPLGCVP